MQRRGTQLRETFPSEPEASTHHVGAVLGHLYDAPKPGAGVGLAGIADLTELARLQSGTCKFVGATEGGGVQYQQGLPGETPPPPQIQQAAFQWGTRGRYGHPEHRGMAGKLQTLEGDW